MLNPESLQPKALPFTVPEPAIARHPGLITAPRELRRWADSLPLGNPPHAAQLLLQQLRLLIRDPDPGGRLGALLEVYERPSERLLEIVSERMDNNPDRAMPLDQLEDALLQLLSELAYGQLRIANDVLAAGKQPTTALLYHALDLLDTAHNVARLHYCERDSARWQQMLGVYLHAQAQQVDADIVDIPPRRHGGPTNIRGLFFRALIIGLCDPHHHLPGDILAWHRWIGGNTDHLGIAQLPQGAFSIPIDTSGELDALAGARRGRPGPDTRYLVAEDFLRALRDDADAPAGLYDALSGLIKGRKSPDQRKSPRQPRNHPFHLLFGLRDAHARLQELTAGGAPIGEGSTAAALQVNHSRDGAAFHLQRPLQTPLGVGDIVLAEADSGRPGGAPVGFVGRIQRVVAGASGRIEIGVEKLGGRLIPVTLSGGAAERARGDCYGLLQQDPNDNRFRLLAIRNVYRNGDSVTAESINARYTLRMGDVLSATRRIAYVDVDVVD
ncbi:MAG: hypothetical protein QNJ91_05550 [Gammaproteobacteria bacterium]|nr:hypothetical protein [Gammaproteobacteria bacterium]